MTGYHHYKVCIEACLRCAAVCTHCAITSSKESGQMADCIQLSSECAVICYAAAELMSLGSSRVPEIAKLCAAICDECAEECNKHTKDHCLECAEACTKCADECEIISKPATAASH
ncbi:MAG: four-helix bundle copper-binding protein [Ferruginibacter sp.]